MTLRDFLDHPVSEVVAFLGSLGLAAKAGLVVGVLSGVWQTIGTIFTGLSILGFTVAPNVDALSGLTGLLQGLAIAAAVVFIAKLGYRAKQKIDSNV